MVERSHHRSIVFPLLLILLGLYWLAYNLDWVAWSPWRALFTLWPVILIAIGLDILLARANPWVSVTVAFLFMVGVLVLLLFTTAIHYRVRRWYRPVFHEVSVPLEGARQARLVVNWTGGEIRLQAAPSTTDRFLSGHAHSRFGRGLAIARSRIDNQLEVNLRPSLPVKVWGLAPDAPGTTDLDLYLHPAVPTSLKADLDLVDGELDLRATRVARMDLELDLGRGIVVLPDRVTTGRARISVDLGRLEVVVPPTVAAQIRLHGSLTHPILRNPRFRHVDHFLRTEDYASAEHRWDVTVDADLARVVIR